MSPVAGVIVVENAPTVDGRMIVPGALTWETPLPVFMMTPQGKTRTVGKLDLVMRVRDYVIGYGEVTERYPVLPCGVGLDDVDVDGGEWDGEIVSTMLIKSGKIIEVTVYFEDSSQPAWPGCALLNNVAPVCTTCGYTCDDRLSFCSNSFHLGRPL